MRPPKQQTIPTQKDVNSSISGFAKEEEEIIEETGEETIEETEIDKTDKDDKKEVIVEEKDVKKDTTVDIIKNDFIPKLRSAGAKRNMKLIAIFLFGAFLFYKMFFSEADDTPTKDQIEQDVITLKEEKPKTSKDFAKENIPLDSKPGGSIAKKTDLKEDKNNNIERKFSSVEPKEVKLEAPELPPLPEIDLQPRAKPIQPPKFGGIRNKNISAQQNVDNFQQQDGIDSQQQGGPQKFDPQNVISNGIPIINSADLTLEQKRQLTMFVMNGAGPNSNGTKDNRSDKSDVIVINGSVLSIKKKDEKVNSEQVADLDITLIQGKILDAVLETAINSQLPGTVRGIVTDDVYAETGKNVLIPRGTRLYGTYSSTITRGQSRIAVSWTRLIRPDGVSVSISAQASDQFGRAGLEGDVDSRFGETLANSLLVTFATLGTALALNQIAGGSASQTQTSNPALGTITTSNVNPITMAAQSAIQSVQNITQQLTQGSTNLQPIVTLPQGTKIKVMLVRDITINPFKKAII